MSERSKEMVDYLKSLRIGIVNLIGISLPGFLFCCIVCIGIVLPLHSWLYLKGINFPIRNVLNYRVEFTIMIMITSYIIGYLIRLKGMQEYDMKSGHAIKDKLDKKDKKDKKKLAVEKQTYKTAETGEINEQANGDNKPEEKKTRFKLGFADNDEYPYYNLRRYLEDIGYVKLLKYVTWDDDVSRKRLTRTHINFLKQRFSQGI